jgi:hypothetical protein
MNLHLIKDIFKSIKPFTYILLFLTVMNFFVLGLGDLAEQVNKPMRVYVYLYILLMTLIPFYLDYYNKPYRILPIPKRSIKNTFWFGTVLGPFYLAIIAFLGGVFCSDIGIRDIQLTVTVFSKIFLSILLLTSISFIGFMHLFSSNHSPKQKVPQQDIAQKINAISIILVLTTVLLLISWNWSWLTLPIRLLVAIALLVFSYYYHPDIFYSLPILKRFQQKRGSRSMALMKLTVFDRVFSDPFKTFGLSLFFLLIACVAVVEYFSRQIQNTHHYYNESIYVFHGIIFVLGVLFFTAWITSNGVLLIQFQQVLPVSKRTRLRQMLILPLFHCALITALSAIPFFIHTIHERSILLLIFEYWFAVGLSYLAFGIQLNSIYEYPTLSPGIIRLVISVLSIIVCIMCVYQETLFVGVILGFVFYFIGIQMMVISINFDEPLKKPLNEVQQPI